MPFYDVEVIHTITYRKRVRAKDEQEAKDKLDAMWTERDLKHMVDEYVDRTIEPVAYKADAASAPTSGGAS